MGQPLGMAEQQSRRREQVPDVLAVPAPEVAHDMEPSVIRVADDGYAPVRPRDREHELDHAGQLRFVVAAQRPSLMAGKAC